MSELGDELISQIAKALSEQFTKEAINRETFMAAGFGLVFARVVKVLEANGLPGGEVLSELQALQTQLSKLQSLEAKYMAIPVNSVVDCLKSPKSLGLLNS